MFARYFNWLTEADLVDSRYAALVLILVDEVLDDIAGVVQVSGNVAADPVSCVVSLALYQIPNDRASTVIGRTSPYEADSAVGGVCHTRVHNGSRGCCAHR